MLPFESLPKEVCEKNSSKKLGFGNAVEFETFFKSYYHPLCVHAFSFTKDAILAEDLVCEVFMKIWERRAALDIETSVKSYLYRAVSNQCIDYFRKTYVKKVVFTDMLPNISDEHNPSVASIPETKELSQAIELAIKGLPKQCGLIFRMSKEYGLKYQEIADRLNISIKTVETQMGRAFKALRIELQPQTQLA